MVIFSIEHLYIQPHPAIQIFTRTLHLSSYLSAGSPKHLLACLKRENGRNAVGTSRFSLQITRAQSDHVEDNGNKFWQRMVQAQTNAIQAKYWPKVLGTPNISNKFTQFVSSAPLEGRRCLGFWIDSAALWKAHDGALVMQSCQPRQAFCSEHANPVWEETELLGTRKTCSNIGARSKAAEGATETRASNNTNSSFALHTSMCTQPPYAPTH